MNDSERHLQLLTETTEAVNSSLDLEEVMKLIARKVAEALEADACFVYLYDERSDALTLRATFGAQLGEEERKPRMRIGEGLTGSSAAIREPVMIAKGANLDPRFKAFKNLPEGEYESILAVPILARETLEGALNVRTKRPRKFSKAEIDLLLAIAGQVAQSIQHARLYEQAQWRVRELEALATISDAVAESLYVEESLEAIVKTTMQAVAASGAAVVLEDGRIAWPEGESSDYAVRIPLRWRGRQVGELVCDKDTPFTDEERTLLASIGHHAAVAIEHGRAVMRGVMAQEIHHRVKNNLQTVASLLRLHARAEGVDAQQVLADSVNRILAIAAVHEVLTKRQDDDVDLADLIERLRTTIVQGLGSSKSVSTQLEPISLPGNQATSLALVFTELLQNAIEHGGDAITIELSQKGDAVHLTVADDGPGISGEGKGIGLEIVRALVKDELHGKLELRNEGGLRAELSFPLQG